jgi:outer membrane protein assembly factor BamE (lipoprotein component of BamABCDE complex)
MKTLALWIFVLAAMAGCASYDGRGLRPGVSTEAEVRQMMGEPAMQFPNPDGSRQLVYPRGPMGTQTFMVHVNGNGVVTEIEPVLNDEHFNRIQPGLTKDDILRMLGPPRETMRFSLSGNEAWDYLYVDTWGYRAIFSVTFDPNGVVVSKFSRRIERPGLAF